jgi:hypothetical protein
MFVERSNSFARYSSYIISTLCTRDIPLDIAFFSYLSCPTTTIIKLCGVVDPTENPGLGFDLANVFLGGLELRIYRPCVDFIGVVWIIKTGFIWRASVVDHLSHIQRCTFLRTFLTLAVF